MSGGAKAGEKRALKLTTEELKRDAYAQYCAHIAQGLSKESFVFNHPEVSVIWETMENYIKADPVNFPPIQKKQAEAESLSVWEKRGLDMMLGTIEKCQPAIFQMFMRNKFGWDKQQHSTNNSETDVRKFMENVDKKV